MSKKIQTPTDSGRQTKQDSNTYANRECSFKKIRSMGNAARIIDATWSIILPADCKCSMIFEKQNHHPVWLREIT